MMVLSFFKFSDRRSRSPFFSVRVFSRFRFPRGEPKKNEVFYFGCFNECANLPELLQNLLPVMLFLVV